MTKIFIEKAKKLLSPAIWMIGLSTRRPKTVFAAYLTIVAILAIGIKDLQFENHFGRDLPKGDPILQTNQRFEEIFGEKDLLLTAIVNDEGIYNEETLRKVFEITNELEQVEGVIAGSVKSLCTVKNISGSESGLDISPFFEEAPSDQEEVLNVQEAVLENFMSHGRLVSLDGTTTLLRTDLEPDHDVAVLYEQVQALAAKYSHPERIYFTGDTIVDYEVTSSMRIDVTILFPCALLLSVVILLAAFRRFESVLAPSIAVISTTAASLGVMGFAGFPLTVVGTILPVVIVAVVSAYGIHMVNAFNYERENGGARREVLKRTLDGIGGPITISALTSAAGFGSLIIFKIRSIHDFGLILAIAIIFGLSSALILIPSLLAILPDRARRERKTGDSKFVDRFMLNSYDFVERRRRPFVAFASMCFVFAVFASFLLKVGLEPAKFFPEGHPTRGSLDVFDEKLGGSTYFNVMIEADEADGIMEPETLKQMDEFSRFAGSQKHVGYVASFVDVVRRLHEAFGEDDEAAGELPDEKSQVAQYLLLYGISGDPTDFDELVDYEYRRAKLRVMLNTYDDAEHLNIYERLSAEARRLFGERAKVEFGGRAMILLGQDRYIVVGKILNIICSLVIVSVACMLYFRSVTGGLLSVIPLALSTVYTFGLMGLTGMRLNLATAMTTGIAVGVGVDFAVHYIHRFRHELNRTGDETEAVRQTLLSAGKGIIFNALAVSCGFMVFSGSRFQVLREFGWLIALTMLTCALGTLLFLPPLIRALRPYFIYGREPEYLTRALLFPPIRIPALNIEIEPYLSEGISSRLKRISHYF